MLIKQSNLLAIVALIALSFQCVAEGQLDLNASASNATASSEKFPERPIKVVVPFGAGGGSDTFARILQRAIHENDLLDQPIVIINVPGAGGSIGSRQVMESQPDGYTILCLHEGMISAKYAGIADYGPEAFEPVAGTGEVGNVIAVHQDSRFENLKQLMAEAAQRPEEIVFSANIGAPSHFMGLMLEGTHQGARFRYTQTGGGAKRYAALVGGHIDVSAFSMAEYKQFESSGLRALASCGVDRHPAAPDVPSATEQGFDLVANMTHWWWAPQGTPPERIKVISATLQKAMQTPEVKKSLAAIHTDPRFFSGQELQDSLQQREQLFANVAMQELTQLPNSPAMVSAVVALLALVVAFQSVSARNGKPGKYPTELPSRGYPLQPHLAVAAAALTVVYVLAMQFGWSGFPVATFAYIVAVGMLLLRFNAKRLPVLLVIALAMSLGFHYVFTNVFEKVWP